MTQRTIYLSCRAAKQQEVIGVTERIIPQLSIQPQDDEFSDVIYNVYYDLCTDPIAIVSAANFGDYIASLFAIYADGYHFLNRLAFMNLALIAQYQQHSFYGFKLTRVYDDLICCFLDNLRDDVLRASILIYISIETVSSEKTRLGLILLMVSNTEIGMWYSDRVCAYVLRLNFEPQLLHLQLLILQHLLVQEPITPYLFEFDYRQLINVVDATNFALEAFTVAFAFYRIGELEVASELHFARFLDDSCSWRTTEMAMMLLYGEETIGAQELALCTRFLISRRSQLRVQSVKIQQKFGFDLDVLCQYIDYMGYLNDSEFVVKNALRGLAGIIESGGESVIRYCKMLEIDCKLAEQLGEFGVSVDAIIKNICAYF